jgi:pyruvate kinase
MYRGVYPSIVNYTGLTDEEVQQNILKQLKGFGIVQEGDLVILTRGEQRGNMGGTNRLEIVKVP